MDTEGGGNRVRGKIGMGDGGGGSELSELAKRVKRLSREK